MDSLEPPKILLVDDCHPDRVFARCALDEIEYAVLEASSGEEAARLVLDHDVALILLDVRMPALNGYETARLIRSRPLGQNVPIIFVTGTQPDSDEMREAYRLGAVDFLCKPIAPELLRAKVSVFVDLHQSLAVERLREADRRKDEFLAILGHELRNPLVPLSLGLRRIADADLEPTLRRVCESMERQLDHLVRLVDDLCDISRITSGAIPLATRPMRCSEVIDRAVALALPDIEDRGIELSIDSREDSWLGADDVRLPQAVANLLDNAARYGRPGGHIEIACRRRGEAIEISVRDDGIGMEADLLDRAFEMFAQEHPGLGGLGIGLSLTRQLVELHRGTIAAASPGRDRGSTFVISLPAGTPPGKMVIEPAPVVIAATGLRIVVVEDDADLRDAVGELLRVWGHQVRLIGTGEEALAAILESPPDIAVVDIGLPDIDGYQLAESLRAVPDAAPLRLIAMTGFGQRRDCQRALDAGFDAHITKPPKLDALRALLRIDESHR